MCSVTISKQNCIGFLTISKIRIIRSLTTHSEILLDIAFLIERLTYTPAI